MKQDTRRKFLTKLGMGVGALSLISSAPPVRADPAASAPAQNAPADKPHVQHIRKDGSELGKMGNGDIAKGMNKLGDMGYHLHSVTTITNTGEGGFHLFKRQPQSPAGTKYEFKLISDFDLGRLAGGDFNKGMQTLEKDGWEIVAYTELANGSVAYYYLQRVKS